MSYGLRCWNAAGQMTVSIHSQLTRFITTGTRSGNVAAQSSVTLTIWVSGMLNNGRWAVYLSEREGNVIASYSVSEIGAGFFRVVVVNPQIESRPYYFRFLVFAR